jgi:tetratricopeptide (TPR) repeat protein
MAYASEGKIAGVIGCGAGFHQRIQPSRSVSFAFFGTVGADDFNYPELRQMDETLDGIIPHRIETFEGGHDWASSDLCAKAVEWMELEAMKAGRRARDDAFIDESAKNREAHKAAESSGMIYRAYLLCEAIASDYKGLRDVSEFEKKAAELRNSKEVREAAKREKDQIAEQKRRAGQLVAARARLRSSREAAAAPELAIAPAGIETRQPGQSINTAGDESEERRLALADLRRALGDLKKKAEAKEDTAARRVARRALSQYQAYSFEMTMLLFQTKRYSLAAENLEVESEINPDNPRLLYQLACAHSYSGNKKKALDALKKAVERGFKNADEIANSRALEPLRSDPAFEKIVEGIRRKDSKQG